MAISTQSSEQEYILVKELETLYGQIMWLAKQPNVTPSMARAWYTHIVAERVKLRIRMFSGKVSQEAIDDLSGPLRLEHHMRIQTTLTCLVKAHLKLEKPNPHDFISVLRDCEQVHIVTFRENYDAMSAGGDYQKAGIALVDWNLIPQQRRQALWKEKLSGKVANAWQFT